MDSEKLFIRWVEYDFCEMVIVVYENSISPRTFNKPATFDSFCLRVRDSLVKGSMSQWERGILLETIEHTNRIYCLSNEELGSIVSNFFLDYRWKRYVKAIEMMKPFIFNI